MRGELADTAKAIATTSPTFMVINDSMNAGEKPEDLQMLPVIIPDHDTDILLADRVAREVVQELLRSTPVPRRKSKPWWRFW